jgi:hypothetical protein
MNEAVVRGLFDLSAIEATLTGSRADAAPGASATSCKPTSPRPDSSAAMPSGSCCAFAQSTDSQPPRRTWIGEQEVDAYWPDARVAVGVDSRAFHVTPLAFEEDRRRDRRLAAKAIQVTRITRRDFDDAAELAAQLGAIRARRLAKA